MLKALIISSGNKPLNPGTLSPNELGEEPHFLIIHRMIGISMARMISSPGGEIYARYRGWFSARSFLTSDRNQFPTNMAATSGARILIIFTKSGTVFSSV